MSGPTTEAGRARLEHILRTYTNDHSRDGGVIVEAAMLGLAAIQRESEARDALRAELTAAVRDASWEQDWTSPADVLEGVLSLLSREGGS